MNTIQTATARKIVAALDAETDRVTVADIMEEIDNHGLSAEDYEAVYVAVRAHYEV